MKKKKETVAAKGARKIGAEIENGGKGWSRERGVGETKRVVYCVDARTEGREIGSCSWKKNAKWLYRTFQ